jgi:hypothetical protein
MINHRRWSVVAVALALLLSPSRAPATQKFGPLQLSGNLQSQNLVRHPDVSTYQFIQNRNTAHIQLQYNWLEAGKFYGKYNIPFVERSSLFILYRGVYDSIYDTTPGFIEKEDIHGDVYGVDPVTGEGLNVYELAKLKGEAAGDRRFARKALTVSGLGRDEREALKFDNQLREAYIDLKLRSVPLSIRAGRQQIVWGETDNFRMLDRANPLDLTWHFVWEVPPPAFGWDEIRRPLWMFKFLYDIGDVWKLSQNFLEWYWNPGDWWPAKQAFLPRPWGLRFMNPLTNPVDGAFIGAVCSSSPNQFRNGPNAGLHYCDRLMNNTKLFNKGNYDRDPVDNSQVGVRYHGLTPIGLEFTLNYFYQRFAGDDGTNYAPLRGLPNTTQNRARAADLLAQGVFPAEAYHPYVHTIGLSANYSDEAYTQTVFRAETIYDVGIPFFDLAKETTIDDPALPGITKKNMWKGMIAFDRPTWIKSLNKKSTIFLTGQFFWHYMVNNPGCDAAVVQTSSRAKQRAGSCLVGGLDLPSTIRNGRSPETATFRDKIRDWETIFTAAAFTFYRGGSIVPVVGMAVDPSNQFAMLPFWTIDYVVRDDFVVNIAQRYFVNPRGADQLFSAWGLAGLNSGRSETSLRFTYQF